MDYIMERTPKEKALAYKMVRDLAAALLIGEKKSTEFQRNYIRPRLNRSKNDMSYIAQGIISLTHEEAEFLAESLWRKIKDGKVLDSEGNKTNDTIKNIGSKKQIFINALKYFLEIHDIDREKIEEILNPHKKIESDQYTIIEGSNVTKDDIRKALKLDDKYYKYQNPSDEAFDIEMCMDWFKKNNKIYTMVKENETGDIVGYINAVPVTESCYNEIKNGDYPDAEIKPENLLDYGLPGKYNLYFASIMVESEKNLHNKITKLLYEAFIDKLIGLAKNGYIVTRILADAISEEGKKLCRGRMNEIKQTNHDYNSTIYEKVLYPPYEATLSKEKELYDLLYRLYKDSTEK